jgi:hypothetical protein
MQVLCTGEPTASASGWPTCERWWGWSFASSRRAKPQAAMSCSSKLGEAAWARAAGVPIEWTTFLVFDMRNGRIARGRGFLRKHPALEAAGLRE